MNPHKELDDSIYRMLIDIFSALEMSIVMNIGTFAVYKYDPNLEFNLVQNASGFSLFGHINNNPGYSPPIARSRTRRTMLHQHNIHLIRQYLISYKKETLTTCSVGNYTFFLQQTRTGARYAQINPGQTFSAPQ